jgi:NAD(P)-dependent dehydrogenase (short-subunit alcohol dehydrogenase family)
MRDSVVLVTGALTGIGRACCFAFAREGARLIVSARRQDRGDALVRELDAMGAEAVFVETDVRHEVEVEALVDKALQRFGRLDVAINNAGTEGRQALIQDQTPQDFEATFSTNVLGTFLSLKHELRAMMAQRSGSIVNVGSVYGHKGFATGAAYVASKFAIEGLTKSAALEAASAGVRVNAVAPGPVETPMLDRVTAADEGRKAAFLSSVPLGRAGTADEIAAAIVFIASNKCPFLTGEIIAIDGGMGAG